MTRVQVLGTGCSKCDKLTARTREALAALGSDAELVHVHDIEAIVALGAMLTPALAVEDRIVLSGRVPSVDELRRVLADALPHEGDDA